MGALAALVGLALVERCATLQLVERNESWEANDTDSEIARFVREASASEPLLAVDLDGIGFKRAGVRHEVRLNGEPMSGTAWLSKLVTTMLMNTCFENENCTLQRDRQGISMETLEGILEFRSNEGKHKIPLVGHRNGVDFSSPPRMRKGELKEHAKFMLDNTPTDRLWIAIFRDPRSVAISTCYHLQVGCPSPDEFTMKHIQPLSTWISMRYVFWKMVKNLDPTRVKLVFFDDLRTHPKLMIGEIAAFLGVETNVEAAAAEIVKQAPFRTMQGDGELCNYLRDLTSTTGHLVTQAMGSVLNPILRTKWNCGGSAARARRRK